MADEPTSINLAARLIFIFKSINRAGDEEILSNVWARIFELPPTDIIQIHVHLAYVKELIRDYERQVKSLPEANQYLFLEPVPTMLTFVTTRFRKIKADRDILSRILEKLYLASDRLQQDFPETLIPAADLDDISKQINVLITSVKASQEIPNSMRVILFDLLSAIRQSIDLYSIRGIRGVRKELFAVAAQIQEQFSEFEKAQDTPEVQGFMALFKRIDLVTSGVLKVRTFLQAAAPIVVSLLEQINRTL